MKKNTPRRPSEGGSYIQSPKGELKQVEAPTQPSPGKTVLAAQEAAAAAAETATGDRKAASAPAQAKGSAK